MPPTGFEHAVPASDRSQTHAFDRAATGIYFQHGTIDIVHIAQDCQSVICYCVSTSTLLFTAQERLLFQKLSRAYYDGHTASPIVFFLFRRHSNKTSNDSCTVQRRLYFILCINVVKDEPDFTNCMCPSFGLRRTCMNGNKMVPTSFHVCY